MSIEREVKLGVWPGFMPPDLGDLAPEVSVRARPVKTLKAVYHDTPDLRLARWGVTLRHRSGEGSKWTLKLPEGDEGPALVRREVDFDGPEDHMPTGAAELVLAYSRGVALVPVAELGTIRSGVDVIDGAGAKLAEVVDDEVSIIHDGRVAARFREVEVELGEEAPAGLLEAVVSRLREAGAGAPDSTPKVMRALGPRALAPPDVEVRALGRKATVADVVTQAIAASVIRILRHDPGVRMGDDPEDVHQARVGTRRLRSDLRTFAPVLEEAWVEPLRDELRWLADLLGAVRDAEVLEDRLRRQVSGLAERPAEALAPLFDQLARERDEARAVLLSAMTTPRYVTLLDALVEADRTPRVALDAHRPAKAVVPMLVAVPWRRLRAEIRRLPSEPTPDSLHQVRIRAKRARYALEAVSPLVGKKAKLLARAVADLQTVLGDHHDAVVAERWLRQSLSSADPTVEEAVEELIAVQQAEARRCREAWRQAWKRASGKKLRSWL